MFSHTHAQKKLACNSCPTVKESPYQQTAARIVIRVEKLFVLNMKTYNKFK